MPDKMQYSAASLWNYPISMGFNGVRLILSVNRQSINGLRACVRARHVRPKIVMKHTKHCVFCLLIDIHIHNPFHTSIVSLLNNNPGRANNRQQNVWFDSPGALDSIFPFGKLCTVAFLWVRAELWAHQNSGIHWLSDEHRFSSRHSSQY